MNTRGIGMALLVLCVLGGLVAALFTPTIAATLTLQATPGARGTTGLTPTAPVVQPTVPATGVTVLARDTFQRPDQAFWGTSSDGRIWGGDAATSPAFSIVDHAGQITGGQGPLQAVLNVTSSDAELLLSGTVNHFDANGDVNLGGVLRWQDANDWYKALINGSQLELFKDIDGSMTGIGSEPFKAVGGVSYNLRFRVQGSNLFAKAWPSSQAEPTNWMLMVIDTQLVSGVGGVRVWVAPGAVVRVSPLWKQTCPIHCRRTIGRARGRCDRAREVKLCKLKQIFWSASRGSI